MDIAEVITEAKDAMQVRRVFGDPFTGHGTTLIPAASIRGGGGGGQSESPEGRGEGSGGGFGVLARPAGALRRQGRRRGMAAGHRHQPHHSAVDHEGPSGEAGW